MALSRGLALPTTSLRDSVEFETALADLQVESGCPICLDYLKDPVTLICGHNFCYSCLSFSWKDLDDCFPCPVCRFCFPERNLRKNPQLRNLIEVAQLLQIRRSKRKRQEERPMCEKHNQFLTLFCVKDLEILCTQCSFSSKHRKHYICPIKKAAAYHRKILKCSIEPMKNNVERVGKVIALQCRKSVALRKRLKHRKQELHCEFVQSRLFLQHEQEVILRQLRDEEMNILAKLHENIVTFSGHVSTLKHLLKDVEGQYMKPDLELLTHVKSIHHRYQNLKHPELFTFSLKKYGFRLPVQYSGLDRIIKQFQVNVILDLNTAHPHLLISENRKAVQYGRTKQNVCYHPKRFYLCPAVLGANQFSSGRYYWEVEVGNKPKWTLGICQGCLPRNWRNQPSVRDGFWAIGRCSKSGCVALGPRRTQFLPVAGPRRVGIFLDYELGEVSFYDMSDKSLLCTFQDSFTEAVWPYFCVGTDSEPLKILPVPDHER